MSSKYEELLELVQNKKQQKPTLQDLCEESLRLQWSSNDWIEVLKDVYKNKSNKVMSIS